MTHMEFSSLVGSLKSLSPEQMRALRNELDVQLAQPAEGQEAGGNEQVSLAMQRQLLEAGIISELRPPITDLAPYRNRKAVPVEGEPLSETIIRERR